MARIRSFLDRFRPAGTPGRAAGVGVPVDRRTTLARELEPVFAALAGTEAECARIGEEAERQARRIAERGRAQAERIVAAARLRAQAARAEAAARSRETLSAEAARTREAARAQAHAIRRRADERLPGYVSKAVDAVRGLAATPAQPSETAGGDAHHDQAAARGAPDRPASRQERAP